MDQPIPLGTYIPSAVQYLVRERLLPEDPPISAYNWTCYNETEEELVWIKNCVIHSKSGHIIQVFRYPATAEVVRNAFITSFRRQTGHHERGIVILTGKRFSIHFLRGSSHVIDVPFEIENVFPAAQGFFIQRRLQDAPSEAAVVPPVPQNSFQVPQSFLTPYKNSPLGGARSAWPAMVLDSPESRRLSIGFLSGTRSPGDLDDDLPHLFSISDPLADFCAVASATMAPRPRHLRDGNAEFLVEYDDLDAAERVVYVSPCDEMVESSAETTVPLHIMVTRNDTLGQITIWQGWYFTPKKLAPLVATRDQMKVARARRPSSLAASAITGTQTPAVRFDDLRRESFAAAVQTQKKATRRSKKTKSEGQSMVDDEDAMRSRLDPDFQASQRKGPRKTGSMLARTEVSTFEQQRVQPGQKTTSVGLNKRGSSMRLSQDRRSFGTSIYRKSRGSMAASTFSRSIGVGDDDSMEIEGDSWMMDDAESELKRAGHLYSATIDHTALDSAVIPTMNGIRPEFIVRKVHVFPVPSLSRAGQDSTAAKIRVRTLLRHAQSASAAPTLAVWIHDKPTKTCLQAEFQIMHTALDDASSGTPKPDQARMMRLQVPLYRGFSESANTAGIATVGRPSALSLVSVTHRTMNLMPRQGLPTAIALPNRFHVFDPSDIRQSISQTPREVGARRTIEVREDLAAIEEGPSGDTLSLLTADGQRLVMRMPMTPESGYISTALMIAHASLTGRARDMLPLIWQSARSLLREQHTSGSDEANKEEQQALLMTLLSFAIGSLGRPGGRTPAKQAASRGHIKSGSLTTSADAVCGPMRARSQAWDLLKFETPEQQRPSSLRKHRSSNSISKTDASLPAISFVNIEANTRAVLHNLGAQGHEWLLNSEGHTERIASSVRIILAISGLRSESKLVQGHTADYQYVDKMLAACLAQFGHYLQIGSLDWAGANDLSIEYASVNWNFSSSLVSGLSGLSDAQRSLLEGAQNVTTTSSSAKSLPNGGAEAQARQALLKKLHEMAGEEQSASRVIEALQRQGLSVSLLETLPESSAILIRELIMKCQDSPPSTWPAELLHLVGREDASAASQKHQSEQRSLVAVPADLQATLAHAERLLPSTKSHEADRHAIIVQIFPEDRRYVDAARLINPSLTQVAECPSRPEWSDIEHLDQQKRVMQCVMTRTVALPAGNAMIHFESQKPLLSEKFSVPGFSMLCQMKPMDNTISADRTTFTEDKFSWAFFHAGASAGLHISRNAAGIDTSWIVFNKPQELTNRHAGFLLALGLNGHLKTMAKWLAFKYLTPKHTMTSIGLLLGLSASYMGTMDSLITRMLSVHITRMLPAGAAELNVSPLTQTAGLLGIGLLYCNTQHRRMSEMLLSELEYRDAEDTGSSHDSLRDESYRLAAGFALGLINLGKGSDLRGLHGMDLLERLLSIAVGPRPVETVHVVDKATAASIMAIALIYMKSNDASVARKIDVPDTLSQLEYVRPDALLLRALTTNLIMWNSISDKPGWIRAQLPSYCPDLLGKGVGMAQLRSADIPTYNIIAGHAWALSLRYAGSGSVTARDEILAYLNVLWEVSQQPALYYDAQLTRTTVRRCIDILALSAATVMAGTGDLVTFRYLRRLHGRTDEETTYGSHMAAHLAIGALFLGGGTYTFSTSNLAVACLIMAFYPLFPSDVLDNAVHLQAFRHLWVLAAEARCVVVADADSQRPITTPLQIRLRSGEERIIKAPCLLPEIDTIASLQTVDPAYWHAKLDFENNAGHLKAFKANQTLTIRKAPASAASPLVFSQVLNSLNESQNKPAWAKMWTSLLRLQSFAEFKVKDLDTIIPGSSRSVVHNDERTTAIDDRLSLWSDAHSWDVDRLSNIRSLLTWAEGQSAKAKGHSGWLGDAFVNSLESVIERRMTALDS